MMKNIVRSIKSYKKSFKEGKDKKEGKEEIKEHAVVIEDPAQVLEEENQQEESSEEVININGEEITQSLDFLHTSLKKLFGSNRQLSSVGKHLSTQITDTAIEKQLIAGYPLFIFSPLHELIAHLFHHYYAKITIYCISIHA
jgi:hypothetical protein